MNVGIRFKSVALGLLGLLLCAACTAGYIWIVSTPINPTGRSGQQILILIFAPAAAIALIYFVALMLKQIWIGLTRFSIDVRGLVIRSPLRTRHIPRTSVRDFVLPPATFPKAPQTLGLLLANDRQINVPIERFRQAQALPLLVTSIPGLADWSLERVRTAKPKTLSPSLTRWRLYKSNLFALYGSIIFFLFALLGTLVLSWEFTNYLRIQHSHLSATGRITEITEDSGKDKTVWARVEYTAANGHKYHLHRTVDYTFNTRFKVGDQVTVDYLPSHQNIGRIRDWDTDKREWLLSIILLPLLPITYRATKGQLANWFRPLRELLFWGGKSSTPVIAISGAKLATLYPLLPDKHIGAIILKPPKLGSKKPSLDAWTSRFKKAGIEAHKALGKFVILDPIQVRRMFDRLGGDSDYEADYMVLDCQTVSQAETLLLENLAASRSTPDNSSSEKIRFHFLDKIAGSFDAAEKRATFQTWITQRLARLYGGATPPEIPIIDFANLLKIDPADGMFNLLIERRRSGLRLLMRPESEAHARLLEFTNGRWITTDNVKPPKYLKMSLSRRIKALLATPAVSPKGA